MMIVKPGRVIRSGPLASPSARPRSLIPHPSPREVGVATFLQGIATRWWSQIVSVAKFLCTVAMMAQDRRCAVTVLPFSIQLAGFYYHARNSANDPKRAFPFRGLYPQQSVRPKSRARWSTKARSCSDIGHRRQMRRHHRAARRANGHERDAALPCVDTKRLPGRSGSR